MPALQRVLSWILEYSNRIEAMNRKRRVSSCQSCKLLGRGRSDCTALLHSSPTPQIMLYTLLRKLLSEKMHVRVKYLTAVGTITVPRGGGG